MHELNTNTFNFTGQIHLISKKTNSKSFFVKTYFNYYQECDQELTLHNCIVKEVLSINIQ
mgnify:CR=1 FL=1